MAKTHKLKGENYWDSNSVMYNKDTLPNYLVGKIITFTKSINIAATNTWYDTGISGMDLSTGTYIMEAYTNSYSVNSQYGEKMSGIIAWYSGETNSSDADEIPLSKAGHARNSHNIKLRVTRQSGRNPLKLQISDTTKWSGTGEVTFTFRKLI